MRVVGGLLFILGGAGTGYSVWAAFAKRRPVDLLFSLLAPIALVVGLLGALLLFVPDFLW